MPAQTKKTPNLIKKVVALHDKGASAREIGEALSIRHTTVAKWLRDMNLEPNGGAGARKTRKRSKSTKDEREIAVRAAEIKADLATGFTAIDALRFRLAQARQMVKEVDALYVAGKASATQVKAAHDLEKDAARTLAELEAETSAKTGPSGGDPFTEEAAMRVTLKFRELVEKEERKRREGERRAG